MKTFREVLARTKLVPQLYGSDEPAYHPILGSAGILTFEPKLVGSANEGTRPFLPDEYDYMLALTELKKFIRFKQDPQNITTCHLYLNSYGKKKRFLRRYVVKDGKFDLFIFKQDLPVETE